MATSIASKESLKEVFSGISSVLFSTTSASISEGAVSFSPQYDLPVHVDDLSLTEDAPTVNHYKVFGLDVDWTSTTTKGDFNISLLVPTLHNTVLTMCYGASAVTNITTSSIDIGNATADSFTGVGVELGEHQITGTLGILNQAKDKLLIISNVSLWASIEYENGTTDPVGIRLTGTIETNGTTPDIIYLKKSA